MVSLEAIFGELMPLAPLICQPREKLNPAAPGFRELLTQPFLDALIRLDLPACLYYQVLDENLLPPPVRNGLHLRILRQVGRDLKLQKAEEHVLGLLREAGLEAVPIKGLDYARALGTQPGERPTRDVDILLRQEDFEEAVGILKTHGFQPVRRFPFAVDWRDLHDQAFVMPGLKVMVELHHHFFDVGSLRHLGEDRDGSFMPLFWKKGVKGNALTDWGRWCVSAARWVGEGAHRGLALRDLVEVHSKWSPEPGDLQMDWESSGTHLWMMFAHDMANFLSGHTPTLGPFGMALALLTQGCLEHPLPQPSRKYWRATRPPLSSGELWRTILFPGKKQLAFIHKREISNVPAWLIAQVQWWLKGVRS